VQTTEIEKIDHGHGVACGIDEANCGLSAPEIIGLWRSRLVQE
jgi:hypothetical protein